jgi:hypothetical protein
MELAAIVLMFALSFAISLASAWAALEAVMAMMTRPVAPAHAATRLHSALGAQARAA